MQDSAIKIRRRLTRLVTDYPGLHLRELARESGQSEALAGYHLDALEKDGVVASENDGIYRRFYPSTAPHPGELDRELMTWLRQRVPLEIAVRLLDSGPAYHKDLTASLGLAKSTVTYHLQKLEKGGLVRTDAQGRVALTEPQRVHRLLVRWEPPSSLVDRFAEVWNRLYSRRAR